MITFISPADWMMFQAPKGLDFTSIKNTRGQAIKSTIEKLETMEEFRTEELMKVLNKQYSNVCLESSNRVKLNSVVLVRRLQGLKKFMNQEIIRKESLHLHITM